MDEDRSVIEAIDYDVIKLLEADVAPHSIPQRMYADIRHHNAMDIPLSLIRERTVICAVLYGKL